MEIFGFGMSGAETIVTLRVRLLLCTNATSIKLYREFGPRLSVKE